MRGFYVSRFIRRSMRVIALGSFIVLFAIIAGIITMPSAFAAQVSVPAGTGVPGCEETNECWLPAEISIGVGETVTWSNDDTTVHTVTSGTPAGPSEEVGALFNSDLFMAGTTFSHTFDETGTFPYFCMVHPWMQGVIIVEAAGAEGDEGVMVEIETGSAGQGEVVTLDVTFTDMTGGNVENVNYDIIASQGNEVVLDVKGAHEDNGIGSHTTTPLPLAASDTMPLNIQVTFNGFGIEEPFTGPIGQVATKQVVPEFGTITMMILGVSIVSIIAITTKSKIFPKI